MRRAGRGQVYTGGRLFRLPSHGACESTARVPVRVLLPLTSFTPHSPLRPSRRTFFAF